MRFCLLRAAGDRDLLRARRTSSAGRPIRLYGAVCLLLVLVEALGHISGGGQRWLDLGPLVLQPSELMKPAIVLVLASFYNTLPRGDGRRTGAR